MTYSKWLAAIGAGTITLLGACTPAPEPVAMVIYAEPTFDKFGNPSCRPGNIPVGGAFTQNLPLCAVTSTGAAAGTVITSIDDSMTSDDIVPDPGDDDTSGGGQNQNRNQNENQNQSQNTNG
jgi:hypothetical protein